MPTALLLIDVQQCFCARPYWSETDVPDFLRHTNTLLVGCQKQGVPVLRILHSDGLRQADNPFAPASGLGGGALARVLACNCGAERSGRYAASPPQARPTASWRVNTKWPAGIQVAYSRRES